MLTPGIFLTKGGRWGARISLNGRDQFLGTFGDEEAAARAYDEKARQLHDNPALNFLPDGSLNSDRRRKYVASRNKQYD